MSYLATFLLTHFFLNLKVFAEVWAPRILGGTDCDITLHPYVVTLFDDTGVCGGSLVTFEWVLTAAHCIEIDEIKKGKASIRAGCSFHNEDRCVYRKVKSGVIYEKFHQSLMYDPNSDELRYDIGLLLLEKPLSKSSFINIIKLPLQHFSKKCTEATAVGVGLTELSPFGPTSTTSPLQCVNLTIVDKATCQKTWTESIIDDTIFCTMEFFEGKDACTGDSGGPILCNGVIIGIISQGKSCGLPNVSAVYTKVEKYLGFIDDVLSGKIKPSGNGYDSNIYKNFINLGLLCGIISWLINA